MNYTLFAKTPLIVGRGISLGKAFVGRPRPGGVFPVLFLFAFLVSLAFSCASEKPGDKISAVVSILPQAYFVERIGGDRVDVGVLVRPGQSPATYEPTPRQVAALARSQVFFRIGVPYENAFVPKIMKQKSKLRVVDLRKGIDLRRVRGKGEHGEGVLDPHIWLDPKLAKIQARTIFEALARLDPSNAGFFEKNLREFHADLDRIDARIAGLLSPYRGGEFLVFHPAFGYLGASYGLVQVAVETEGKEPGARRLARIIDLAKEKGIRVIFVQPQFSSSSARAVAQAIGGAVVPMDPLSGDYLENLEAMAESLKEGLGGKE